MADAKRNKEGSTQDPNEPVVEEKKRNPKRLPAPDNEIRARPKQICPLKVFGVLLIFNGISMVIVANCGMALKIPMLATGICYGIATTLLGAMAWMTSERGERKMCIQYAVLSFIMLIIGGATAFTAVWIYLQEHVLISVTKYRHWPQEWDVLCAMVFFGGSASILSFGSLIALLCICKQCCTVKSEPGKAHEIYVITVQLTSEKFSVELLDRTSQVYRDAVEKYLPPLKKWFERAMADKFRRIYLLTFRESVVSVNILIAGTVIVDIRVSKLSGAVDPDAIQRLQVTVDEAFNGTEITPDKLSVNSRSEKFENDEMTARYEKYEMKYPNTSSKA